jgi:predicted MFS family arabinose efflux permease
MITNYTYGGMIFSPLTIAWTSSADKKENMVVLTIRFFMANNQAYLPETFNGPQIYID